MDTKIAKLLAGISLCLFFHTFSFAQTETQVLRGQILDKETQAPLPGATVQVDGVTRPLGAFSDDDGYFRIPGVPLGRRTIKISYLGYEPLVMEGILFTSGKEKVLTIEMSESITELETVEIVAADDKHEAQNEMATVSARSFSVEETRRYPAAIFDPARMAQNFAGVVSAGFDMENDIVIRGNSPRYMQWRLEGIPIPNPNHFGSIGNSGGPISMLSSSTMGNSDFYTGAFPAEFGDALSGVFDLSFRKGNNEKRESSFMIGVLGIEASTEGYFSKKSKASYLVNYRYSTLALMSDFIPSLDGVMPTYQDLSFKVHIPTKAAGTFSVFGLGGTNNALEEAVKDSAAWESQYDAVSFFSRQNMGVAGISHKILLGPKTYLKSVAAVSADNYMDDSYRYVAEEDYREDHFDITDFQNYAIRVQSVLNHKINAKHVIRAGFTGSHLSFNYQYDSRDWVENAPWVTYFDNSGSMQQLQLFGQWKHRLSEALSVTAGVHGTYLALNHTWAVDPRGAISWQATPRHRLSLAAGLHSKPEHVSTFLLEHTTPGGVRSTPNKNLEMTRAAHLVLGHDFQIGKDIRLKTEAYYQYLFNVPVEDSLNSTWSMLNMSQIWDIVGTASLANSGTGRNIGVDLTLEKFFSDNYFFLLTGSVYDSRFKPRDGQWYSTRTNGGYNLTALGGKEFKVGKHKQNVIGLNAKTVWSGGNRYTPINFEASQDQGRQVLFNDRPYEERGPDYLRADVGVSFTLNGKKATHTILMDIQNVTNRQNIYIRYYDSESNSIQNYYQNGMFPILNYRVEF